MILFCLRNRHLVIITNRPSINKHVTKCNLVLIKKCFVRRKRNLSSKFSPDNLDQAEIIQTFRKNQSTQRRPAKKQGESYAKKSSIIIIVCPGKKEIRPRPSEKLVQE